MSASGRIARRPRINVEALESALCTLLSHDVLLEEALSARGANSQDLTRVVAAVRSVIDEGLKARQKRESR